MILPLRRCHRGLWLCLAILLPLLLWAALEARPPRVAPQELPAAVRPPAGP
ncbi:MAG: hypothetical protein R2991_12175 [Thermoanaerobaculia bacterium]